MNHIFIILRSSVSALATHILNLFALVVCYFPHITIKIACNDDIVISRHITVLDKLTEVVFLCIWSTCLCCACCGEMNRKIS